MELSKKIRIWVAAGVLMLGVIVPAAVAWAETDDEAPEEEGLLCFEVDELLPRLPHRGFRLDRESPFDRFDPERLPFDLEDFDLDGLPRLGEIVDRLEAEADELAAYLEEEGIDHEVETGPLGLTWVVWDFTDPEANRAVEEYLEERGGMIGVAGEVLPFDLEKMGGMPELPDLGELLDDLDLDGFDLEELLEGFELEGFPPFGEGFEFPLGERWFELEGPPRGGMVCIGSFEARAGALEREGGELGVLLENAGIDVGFETVEIRVPVWDPDAEGVDELLADFYRRRRPRLFGGSRFDVEGEESPSDEGGRDDSAGERPGVLDGLPWNLQELIDGAPGGADR